MDEISYYVYIVHYIFCVGPLKIVKVFSIYYPVQVIITIVLSIIIATMLNKLTKMLLKKL